MRCGNTGDVVPRLFEAVLLKPALDGRGDDAFLSIPMGRWGLDIGVWRSHLLEMSRVLKRS